jgi:hypothetical protein
MYKPYQMPVLKVSPDVKVSPPRISKLILFIIRILVKPYFFSLFGSAKVILRGDKILFDAFKRALSGESRYIIAFRHGDGREPQLLAWLFLFKLKSLAARKGWKFPLRPHAIFIYGYEVVRWGGSFARFFMPNIAAIPIHHTKVDSKGMAEIFKAITEGPYPVALAPEGQVSYNIESVPRLESGSIRIGFQAAYRLKEKDKNCPVGILPLSIHFRYNSRGKNAMEKLLAKIEKLCGFTNMKGINFRERLKKCRDYILEINERRYGIKIDDSLSFEQRMEKVTLNALETSERMLGIKSEGEYFARLYRVRHVCWDKIFLADVENLDSLTDVDRGVKDLGAGEAWHISRHQELADFSWYFRCPLPSEETALHLKVEYVQNLFDFANRAMGGAFSTRVNLFPSKIIIQTAPIIDLSGRLSQYKENKKDTVDAVKSELEKAYLDCINEVKKNEPA